ncbi:MULTISPECIES: PLP-dependent aminotransferase family protein [unclassified Pseudomonas]|uniref:MocR-like pyridoxine biosynthesis transcription factor PdxR n=1 Tax=unclassified Pseudomonas TaxID=196821 RepID=UPI00209725B9|nr:MULTISPECIES: PLP-dependent aminotransferase family protein [unclassified Pseudomonas]MCO7518622.1 PLP-dependent aminotransferase family protein [Pseudomonas sp. 1]MCO7539108.1 PLP-dependent aminotransferase family protein [Pseudomonas sp. VA159-2]
MREASHALPFDPAGIVLDRRRGLSQQLYQALRARVLDGRLGSGTRLPATRDLAAILGLSRNSVVRAYDQLYAEGFIESRVGDGTYVSQLEKLSTQLSTGLSLGLSTGLSTFSPFDTEDLSSFAAASVPLQGLKKHHLPPPKSGAPRAFRVGVPAYDLFPFDVWAKLHAGFWRNPDPSALGYGDPAGELALRELIATYLRRSRGLSCTAEQILITHGAQEAISLCAQLLLQPGDAVAVENPGYRAAGHAFALAGAQLRGMPVDDEGMDCTGLADCRLAYVTPAHQYPTGVTMSLARRLALLAWAEREQAWIIEDDYDGEYRYSGAPLAPLATLDRQGRVLYVGTFGKIAFPALRLGYLVLPMPLAQAFSRGRALAVRHSEVGTQWVMAQFMAQGHFQRHIRRMRRAALARRDVLMAGWPLDVPGLGAMPEVAAGLHVKVDVDNFAREQALVAQAQAVGVEVNPLSSFWLEDSQVPVDNRAGLVLGFAAVPQAQVADALMRLRRAWK